MNRNVYEIDDYDLSIAGSTKPVPLEGAGPISIQPVLTGLIGNPTYTVQVSNDGENFVEYHKLAKNVAIDSPIWITYSIIPWSHLRIVIDSSGPDAGIVRFKLFLYNYNG